MAQDTLIDQLWGDQPPVNAENALQILISYLRRTIGGDGLGIERGAAGYRLAIDPEAVDMIRFEGLVQAAAGVGPAEQLRLASAALDLWRGPALSEAADDDFAQGDITRLDELRVQAFELRAAAQLALGHHDDALSDLHRLVREHPFRERLHGQLALALYRAGRQAEALRVLDDVRTTLADELGLDPTRELQELGAGILRQDSALSAPVATPVPVRPATDPTPLRPVAAGGEVPAFLTPMIGRAEQLAGVASALTSSRVVTLTGPGGTGKTRLAAETAILADSAVWWADLSAVPDRAAFLATVAASVGRGVASDDDPVGDLRNSIGAQDAVLVLDTCEHLVAAVAETVAALVAGCPGLRVLATSRRALGVPGELVWPVPALSLPDPGDREPSRIAGSAAVQLFVDRAASVRPGFALDAANAADVAEVCLLLDGLPLAIELAAGHAAALTPRKISELLGDRMRLVGDGGGQEGRHRGLRATVEWSYELLTGDETHFIDRLSVFAGPFPLEAAVEVAGAGLASDGLQLLLSLVRQSLVTVEEADHFRLLDTIRAYAAERLAADPAERRAAQDRHARWFAEFAQDADRNIRGADQAGWLGELRAAVPDVRAALRYCLDGEGSSSSGATLVTALSWFWSHEGSFAEARSWIGRARSAGPHEPLLTARLHLATAMHAESVGDLRTAESEAEHAVAAFAALDDARGGARSLLHLGTACWAQGRLLQAAEAQDRSLALFRSVQDDSGAGLALVLRARTALDADDPQLVRELLLDARHVLRRAGDPHLIGICLDQHARTCAVVGELEEAEDLARESLRVFEAVGYREGVGSAVTSLGLVRLARRDPAGARILFLRATTNAVDLGHGAAVAEGFELLAEAAVQAAEPLRAARLLGHAEHLRAEHGLPRSPLQERRLTLWRQVLADSLDGAYRPALAEGRRSSSVDLLEDLGTGVSASERRAWDSNPRGAVNS